MEFTAGLPDGRPELRCGPLSDREADGIGPGTAPSRPRLKRGIAASALGNTSQWSWCWFARSPDNLQSDLFSHSGAGVDDRLESGRSPPGYSDTEVVDSLD